MSERYTKVFSGDETLYVKDAPVVILASALLKDSQTAKVIAQLKLLNVSGKTISYVRVAVTPLDAMKAFLGQAIAFEYLDLSISGREEFGSKKPLVLPNSSTRSFLVGVSHVGFADGTVWTGDDTDWKADLDLAKALKIEATYKKAVALFESDRIEDVAEAKAVFLSIPQTEKDVSAKISLCDEKIARLQAEKEQKEAELKEKATKLAKKATKLAVILAPLTILLVLVGYFVAYPFFAYVSGDYSVYIDMYNIKHFKIPNGVTSIEPNAFNSFDSLEFDSLESVTIPGSVTSIGHLAFYGCHNLKSVTISDGVTSIGEGAFSDCVNLESVTIPDSVTFIGEAAFWNCGLKSVTIPDGVSTVGEHAFEDCSNLESMTIPDSVKTIGADAFSGCDKLESVTIPGSVTSIGHLAFYGCHNLKSVTISDGVTSIGEGAFYGCESLTNITFLGTQEQWQAIDKGEEWDSFTGDYEIYFQPK